MSLQNCLHQKAMGLDVSVGFHKYDISISYYVDSMKENVMPWCI